MRKSLFITGWLLWILGLLYAALGYANSDRVVDIIRDSTLQKHQLWEDGDIRKAQAKIAIFELSERFASFNQRPYVILGSLMTLSTLLIVAGRRKHDQVVQPRAGKEKGLNS